jgi:hypothetical protein
MEWAGRCLVREIADDGPLRTWVILPGRFPSIRGDPGRTEPDMGDDTKPFFVFDVELSPKETFLIGKVIALWAALEYEVFYQTLSSFDLPESGPAVLPKEMNNMQFAQVLQLRKTRVVNTAQGKRRDVLEVMCSKIYPYYDFRNAIAHGMWDWEKGAVHNIISTRIRQQELIRARFTADDLASFVSELQIINTKVRYPGGDEEYMEDFAKIMANGYISRLGVALFSGDPSTKDLFPQLSDVGRDLPNQPPSDGEMLE